MPTTQVIVQLVAFLAILLAARLAARQMADRGRRRTPAALAGARRMDRARASIALPASTPARARPGNATPSRWWPSTCSASSSSTPCSACRASCRSTRRRWPAVSPDSSFNTAVSFVTNTNWQGYGGESTMSYLTQMLALTVQNFFSAATGIAVVWALIRGFAARSASTIGNFWVDVTRSTLYVLLPISIVYARLPGQPGRDPELRRLQGRDDARGQRLPAAEERRRTASR